MKEPTPEALQANPDLLFQGVALLSTLRHPKAAAMNGMMKEGMERAANSDQVEKAQQEAANSAIGNTMNQATGGVVKDVPPEVSGAALKYVKENPKEVMDIMKMAVSLKK